MQYVFYYKKENGKEVISYNYEDDETDIFDVIGDTDKLIVFIKDNCLKCCDVYFEGFESGKIISILNEVSDKIEIYYPPLSCDGPYQMFERLKKKKVK